MICEGVPLGGVQSFYLGDLESHLPTIVVLSLSGMNALCDIVVCGETWGPQTSISVSLLGWCSLPIMSLKSGSPQKGRPQAGVTRSEFLSPGSTPWGARWLTDHSLALLVSNALWLLWQWLSFCPGISTWKCVWLHVRETSLKRLNKQKASILIQGEVQSWCNYPKNLSFASLPAPPVFASNFCPQRVRWLLHLQHHVWITNGKKIETIMETEWHLYSKSKANPEIPTRLLLIAHGPMVNPAARNIVQFGTSPGHIAFISKMQFC